MTKTRFPFAALTGLALVLSACTSARFGDAGGPPPGAPGPGPELPAGRGRAVRTRDLGAAAAGRGHGADGGRPERRRPAAAPAPAAPALPAASGRSGVVGAWTARVAGASCRVRLSSTPALDLYRAGATGCANGDLAKISAWDYRDGEVYLYQSGGTVAARLRSVEGALSGVLAKSGAPLTLSR